MTLPHRGRRRGAAGALVPRPATLTTRLATLLTVLVAVLGGCSAADPPTGPTPRPVVASGSKVPVPEVGAYFGTQFSGTEEERKAKITALEDQIGRKFAIDHVFYRWDVQFPQDYDRWTIAQGRTLFLNWSSRQQDKSGAKWADIAAGRYDALIRERAAAIKALDVPVFLSFTHEPNQLVGDGRNASGHPPDYVRAWRHVVSMFNQAGATNVSWVWVQMAFTFRQGQADQFYPGDDIIDWVGVDGYHNINCPWLRAGWKGFDAVFGKAVSWAEARGKPLMIAEFNLREDPADPQRKAQWLRDLAGEVARSPTIKGIVSFNSRESCAADIATSPEAVEGYKDLGQSPQLQAPAPRR